MKRRISLTVKHKHADKLSEEDLCRMIIELLNTEGYGKVEFGLHDWRFTSLNLGKHIRLNKGK